MDGWTNGWIVVVVGGGGGGAFCFGFSSSELQPLATRRGRCLDVPRRSMASSILLELPPSLSDARGYKADLVHLSEKGGFGQEKLGFRLRNLGWSSVMSQIF